METGELGPLRIGMPYGDVLKMLGPAPMSIDAPDPVHRYSQVEVYVDGLTDLVWMIQLEPWLGAVELPLELQLGRSLSVPADRAELVQLLEAWKITFEIGEHYVPGQEELKALDSAVIVHFSDDGELASLVKVGPLSRYS